MTTRRAGSDMVLMLYAQVPHFKPNSEAILRSKAFLNPRFRWRQVL